MLIAPGTRIHSYEIVTLLGAGGMGEVYRARDTKLGREVAIKVLPELFAADPDRLMRFEREARALAALNHPRIAQIHGLEEADGLRALVMELVEGEDLSQRIARGPIPVDEALAIASQIAEALEAAHEQGIIHRDLKPANIKLRGDGGVKVLDFGLAKALDPNLTPSDPRALDLSPTVTSPALTMRGVILGTAAYMSPEQARGKPVDKRADIWALGCVLFEMLTGRRAFSGDTATDVIAAVVKSQPAWDQLPADTPPRIRTLLARCLQKEPAMRLRDAGDATLDLRDDVGAAFSPPNTVGADFSPPNSVAAPPPARRRLTLVAALVGAVVLAGVAASLALNRATIAGDPSPIRLSITFPPNSPMHLGQPIPSLALSPDGRTVVYTAGGGPEGIQLWMRPIDSFTATPLPGTRNGRAAFFSPDGKWIGFFADRQLKKVPAASGPAIVVCDMPGVTAGGTWTSQDEIVFASSGGGMQLWRVAAAGGTPTLVSEQVVFFPEALPDGDKVVVTLENAAGDMPGDQSIAAIELATGTATRLVNGGHYARYLPSGHLVYARNNELVAARFDPRTLSVGDPKSVGEAISMDPSGPASNFAVSASGTLAFAPGEPADYQRRLVTIGGNERRAITDERRYFEWPRASPDGTRVVASVRSWRDRVWMIDATRGSMSRVTTQPWQREGVPLFSRDGRWLALAAVEGSSWSAERRESIVIMPSDLSRPEERLTTAERLLFPNSFTPDGSTLVYHTNTGEGVGSDLFAVAIHGDHAVRPLLQTPFNEGFADVSPDGRWIAYQTNRSGRPEIWVAPFPSMEGARQVSISGGTYARWSRDGRRLFFYQTNTIWSADFADGSAPVISKPAPYAQLPVVRPAGYFDVMPDGSILFVDGPDVGSTPELRVILNWTSELQRLVPAR